MRDNGNGISLRKAIKGIKRELIRCHFTPHVDKCVLPSLFHMKYVTVMEVAYAHDHKLLIETYRKQSTNSFCLSR